MTYNEVLIKAKEVMEPNCHVCPDCDGRACKGQIPGLGGIGSGNSFTVTRDYFKNIQIPLDVVYEHAEETDTSVELFGRMFSLPFMMAPLGGMNLNYNGYLTDQEYLEMTVAAMVEEGSFAFTPDTPDERVYEMTLPIIRAAEGCAVPTVKPWAMEKIMMKIRSAEEAGAMAVACDIDSCGLINLKRAGKPVYPMSQEKMSQIVESTNLPFIPKGIMTVSAAVRCANAGCYGIVVSNHGGRVLENSPAPASMLPAIREAVGDRLKIFVDGGIRSGADVFKCLALGADAVLIGRPYGVAAHGGGKEGICLYTEKILRELKMTMLMTGCNTVKDITIDKVMNY